MTVKSSRLRWPCGLPEYGVSIRFRADPGNRYSMSPKASQFTTEPLRSACFVGIAGVAEAGGVSHKCILMSFFVCL